MKTACYTAPARLLHWLTALLIFAAFPLGLYMADLKLSPLKLQLISYHKWLGMIVLLLTAFRLGWRIAHQPPALPETLAAWQRRASAAVHHALYLLLFAIPLSGWLMSSAKGFQTVLFGILPIPDLINKNKELGDILEQAHEILNYLFLALLVLHIAAALKHRFVDHDGILERMLPPRSRP